MSWSDRIVILATIKKAIRKYYSFAISRLRKPRIYPHSLGARYFLYGRNPEVVEIKNRAGLLRHSINVTLAHPRSIYILDSKLNVINFRVDGLWNTDSVIFLPYKMRKIENFNEGMLCVGQNTLPNNYYHFFTDVLLPFILIKDGFKNNMNLKIIFNYSLGSQYKEFLDYLRIPYADGDSEKFVKNLISMPKIHIKKIPEAFEILHKLCHFPANINFQRKNNRINRVFINRRRGQRALKNNICDLLKKYEFKEYFMEDYSVLEQASIVGSASHVIAVHGAGITNIIFNSKPNLFEVLPSDPWGHELGYGDGCFKHLCEALDGKYKAQIGGSIVDGFFSVDMDLLDKNLLDWLK